MKDNLKVTKELEAYALLNNEAKNLAMEIFTQHFKVLVQYCIILDGNIHGKRTEEFTNKFNKILEEELLKLNDNL